MDRGPDEGGLVRPAACVVRLPGKGSAASRAARRSAKPGDKSGAACGPQDVADAVDARPRLPAFGTVEGGEGELLVDVG